MVQRLIPSGVLAAIAGAAVAVAVSSSPSLGFTLSSPPLAEPVIKADVQQVWYRHTIITTITTTRPINITAAKDLRAAEAIAIAPAI